MSVFPAAFQTSIQTRFTIIGHTDNVGSAESYLSFSLKRANVVKDYFVANGFYEASIEVVGQDKSEPVVSNDTPEGRKQIGGSRQSFIKAYSDSNAI